MAYTNKKLALEYLAGNQMIYEIIINSFLKNYQNYSTIINQFIKDKDIMNLYNEVHSLKGVTLNFGAEMLYIQSITFLEELRNDIINEETVNKYLNVFNMTYKELSSSIVSA